MHVESKVALPQKNVNCEDVQNTNDCVEKEMTGRIW